MSNFIIDSDDKLKQKMDLVESLIDIKSVFQKKKATRQASKTKTKKEETKLEPNPIDYNYDALKCEIKPLDSKHADYSMIQTYIKNTSHGRNLKLKEVFTLEREDEDKKFNPNKLDNVKLLWHGSRFSNFVGILSNGMRIAPPEAPKTGYNFGKGVYFADLAGKSAPYCCPYLSNNTGIFVLCQVALGNCQEKLRPDCDSDILKKGTHSTHAVGMTRPTPKDSVFMEKGKVEVPLGKTENFKGGHMGANEFIVYNTNQIKMKYLVKFEM